MKGFVLDFCSKVLMVLTALRKVPTRPYTDNKLETLLTKYNLFTNPSKDITLCLIEA